MADWPLLGDAQVIETAGYVSASSIGTSLLAHATPHTKGSWTQLIAATARDSQMLVCFFSFPSGSNSYLVDLAVGAGGSEQIIVDNMLTYRQTGTLSGSYVFPLSIPAGTRLAARSQSIDGGTNARLHCLLVSQGFLPSAPLSRVTTYGAVTADTGGTSVDPGGVAHTKGAWTEITASTTGDTRYLVMALGSQDNTVMTAGHFGIDIGIGAAASETVLYENLYATADSAQDGLVPLAFPPLPCSIPAGTRLAVRAQSDITDATDRLFDAILYGVD